MVHQKKDAFRRLFLFFPRIVFGELQLSVAVTVPTVVLAAVVLSSLPESIREADAVGAFANVVPTAVDRARTPSLALPLVS